MKPKPNESIDVVSRPDSRHKSKRVNARKVLLKIILCLACAAMSSAAVRAAYDIGDYEGRPISAIDIVFEGGTVLPEADAEFRTLLRIAPGTEYSVVRVRESLQSLFDSGRVASARVEVIDTSNAPAEGALPSSRPIRLRFIIKRQPRVADVILDLGVITGTPISEDELRGRLNLLDVGARVTEQTIKNNADLIQIYLRDRGFFRAEVDYEEQLDATGTRDTITFHVKPGEQARISDFDIAIAGFSPAVVRPTLELQKGAPFTRSALGADVSRIRQAIIALGYLAPQLEDANVSLDSANNMVSVRLTGGIGPKVDVKLVDLEMKESEQRKLLPIKRDGNIDYSAIVEGERRLRNKLQEDGYFFAQVEASCSVTPPLTTAEGENGTPALCRDLNPQDLTGRTVTVAYGVERGRRFKLADIRIEGTNKLTIDDVADSLRTKKANALGVIPFFGFGRGYTSNENLREDQDTIAGIMRDLGYRRSEVTVRRGVSIEGEELIITFVVKEGPLTRVDGIDVRGNQIYTEDKLRDELGMVIGAPFSRSEARAGSDRVLNLYARNGYIDAQMDFSVVALPDRTLPDGTREERVRLLYTMRQEGDKVFINRILVNGNVMTKREAIVGAIPLREGDILRADQITDSERILYGTDAFRQVIIRTEPAGENSSGFRQRDVIIDVEELKPRILSYGGGFSTDNGPLGFVDIRNVNLFGKLRQGAFRVRASTTQQTVRLEYFDPRFRKYGDDQFAPLTLSVQYSRDSNVTRFFRSTIDKGSEGIVQFLDENGNPTDQFGVPAPEPTINRFIVNAETQRVLDIQSRSIVFLRYTYEDVRLFNLESLLIRPILQPDRAVRLSGFGAAFVRDTRERCQGISSRILHLAGRTRASEPCQYSSTDATRGDYFSVDYSVALRQLGGNISFNKFLGSYRRYYQIPQLRGTVLAANVTLGLSNIFNPRDRDDSGTIDEEDLTLPISERFFSGGSTTLRGFGYEEAGPRQVICPGSPGQVVEPSGVCKSGIFRKQNGDLVALNPYTVPVGGNALAIVNLEARIPLTKIFQVVPFYDGGNVFRRIGDLFGGTGTVGTDTTSANLRQRWTHTVGIGIRVKTPIGGVLSADYGFLLDPTEFLIPQGDGSIAIFRIRREQVHLRFTQTF